MLGEVFEYAEKISYVILLPIAALVLTVFGIILYDEFVKLLKKIKESLWPKPKKKKDNKRRW